MVVNDFNKIKNFIVPNNNVEGHRLKAYKKGKGWSFDLKIGNEYFLSGDEIPNRLNDNNQYIIIKPGKFGSLITEEKVCIDDKHIGLISVKFTFKQKGLINVSGFHVDPCYNGNIVFTVFNAGPQDIYIKKGDYVFMICFLQLERSITDVQNYLLSNYPNYQIDSKDLCNNNCSDTEGYTSIPKKMIEGFGGNSLTLMENNRRIEQLELYVKIIAGVAIGLIAMSLKHLF